MISNSGLTGKRLPNDGQGLCDIDAPLKRIASRPAVSLVAPTGSVNQLSSHIVSGLTNT